MARDLTDDYNIIDVRRWQREGRLIPGGMFSTGAENNWLATIDVHVSDDGDHLTITHAGGTQHAALDWVPCHFGGKRPYLRCPDCGRRVALLYGGEHFTCVTCRNLAWPVEYESELERASRAVLRTRRLLGLGPGLHITLGEKPKGMRWGRYWRHVANLERYTWRLLRCIIAEMGWDPADLPSERLQRGG